VATIGTFLLDSGRLLLNATGQLNLGDETLALHLRPMLRAGGPGIVVPVRVDGSFREPKLSLDPSVISPGNVAASLGATAASVASGLLSQGRIGGAVAAAGLGERGGDACGPGLAAVRAMAPPKN
jgi:AsmA protein